MIQLTQHMRILVAIEPADFRKGIDGLAAHCHSHLQQDPLLGTVFVFRNHKTTAVKILVYDGQGFWLCQKRLSKGRFPYWPTSTEAVTEQLEAHQLSVLLSGGNQSTSDPEAFLENETTDASDSDAQQESESEASGQPTVDVDKILEETVGEKAERTTDQPKSNEDHASLSMGQVVHLPSTQPTAPCPAGSCLCAEDIMNRDFIWGSPDDRVQDIIPKMRQPEVRCIVIGENGVLEGLVSDTDLAGAISPYLRPEFAHMRTPRDDATLQIKVKWIMSRPVYTIDPKASISDTIGVMRNVGQQHMPVVDKQGRVCGLVTASELFEVILKTHVNRKQETAIS